MTTVEVDEIPCFPIEIWVDHICTKLNLYDWNNLSRTCKLFSALFKKELLKRKKDFTKLSLTNISQRYNTFDFNFNYKRFRITVKDLEFCKVNEEITESFHKCTLFHYVKKKDMKMTVKLVNDETDKSELNFEISNGNVIERVSNMLGFTSYLKKCNLFVIESLFLAIYTWDPTSCLINITGVDRKFSNDRKRTLNNFLSN